MNRRLMELLACPACQSPIDLQTSDGDVVETGTLSCTGCGRSWPIIRGVPRFVEDDAYVGNFSHEWTIHRQTQLDSARGTTESRDAFFEKTGFSPEELERRVVLDVGCGTGRFLEIAAEYAGHAVGFDLSFAVDSAQENLGHLSNVDIVQASVFELPFRPGVFDVAYSIGVLHHTPNTRDAFRQMLPPLRHGGLVALWVYWARERHMRVSDVIRLVTTRMSNERLYSLCKWYVPWVKSSRALHKRVLRRFVPLSESLDPAEAILDTFDWYSPKYQWKHDWDEVGEWLAAEKLEDIRRLTYPVSFRGRKP